MESAYKTLMVGLYHPAITGTTLVLLLTRISLHQPLYMAFYDLQLMFGFVFLGWFSLSFLAIYLIDGPRYSLYEFAFDIVEVVLLFYIFYTLRFFSNSLIEKPDWRTLYITVIITVIIQSLWCLFWKQGHSTKIWILRFTLLAISFLGFLLQSSNNAYTNILMCIAMYIMLFYYAYVIRERIRANRKARDSKEALC